MLTPDTAGAAGPMKKSGREICVPLSALSIDGTAPQAGDDVDFTAKGKVARIDEKNAYVTASEINGEPVAEEEPEMPTEPDDDDVMRAAEEADKRNA